eukprot:m.103613 g.103613  ORF g.103613 m.103613 type:complete len:702 (-) comp27510_c0_seq2:72-2177(-)
MERGDKQVGYNYVLQHKIPDLLQSLVVGMMWTTPDEPIDYLIACLAQIKHKQMGGENLPLSEIYNWKHFVPQALRKRKAQSHRRTHKSLPTKSNTSSPVKSVDPKLLGSWARELNTQDVNERVSPLPPIANHSKSKMKSPSKSPVKIALSQRDVLPTSKSPLPSISPTRAPSKPQEKPIKSSTFVTSLEVDDDNDEDNMVPTDVALVKTTTPTLTTINNTRSDTTGENLAVASATNTNTDTNTNSIANASVNASTNMITNNDNRHVLVLAGPSGVGKSTLLKILFTALPGKLEFVVSHTTRQPRAGEVDGVDYHFVTRETMEQMIANNEMLESAVVHNNIYGTSRQAVNTVTEQQKMCVLDIDIQGVQSLKAVALDATVTYVFVTPPSLDHLKTRLEDRNTETVESLATRLGKAAEEIDYGTRDGNFDHVITNHETAVAAAELKDVVEKRIMNTPLVDSSSAYVELTKSFPSTIGMFATSLEGSLASSSFVADDLKPVLDNLFFVVGGPGSGKGTQCAKILEAGLDMVHYSTGDLLRAATASGSDFGKSLAETMANGKLVTTELVEQVLKTALAQVLPSVGILLDGFPRSTEQYESFVRTVAQPRGVLLYECDTDVLVRRLVKRGETSGRADDKADVIQKRLTTYADESKPLYDRFKATSNTTVMDSSLEVDDVFAATMTMLAAHGYKPQTDKQGNEGSRD